MDYDYKKRGYLLPEGCKDLIDALNLKKAAEEYRPYPGASAHPSVVREITVPEQMTVQELAAVLNQQPFRIIADLMGFGMFATSTQEIPFEAITKVMLKYGYAAKRADPPE